MVIKAVRAFYAMRKSKKVLRQFDRLYRRKAKILDANAKEKILSHLSHLQAAILEKNAPHATLLSHGLKNAAQRFMPRSLFEKARDFIGAIAFALVVAIVVRQMWFEPYKIPTGSMRPTLKEGDFLVVSKTDFGLNVPLTTSHFYFDPSLVQRGSVVVFTSENMGVPDSDTVNFYLFPGKKMFVKRLIGKPGDTLYFYGGKIYGIDAEGKDLADLRDPAWFQSLEHIPFIHFDGKVDVSASQGQGVFTSALFQQMNLPVAKLTTNALGLVSGEVISQKGKPSLEHYSDLWGFKNYAMARLLTKEQLDQMYPGSRGDLEEGLLYLELTHHPSLKEARLVRDEMNRVRPDLGVSVSLIPLQREHLDRIASHMTTCRFIVENGSVYRLGMEGKDPFYAKYFPKISDVPDGTYEIQNGEVSKVYWGGVTQKVPLDHPLYSKDPSRIQFLYNLGIEFLNQYNPAKNNRAYPSRYAYFRDGDLYLLGGSIISKQDPILASFLKREAQKKSLSTSVHPYLPFEDSGAPMTKEGNVDADFIRKYGVTIPDKQYLMLGDNHAMSGDSRQFGFVPQDNLKGCVGFLVFPPGSRWGTLSQPMQSHFAFPNVFVWGTAILITAVYAVYRRKGGKNSILPGLTPF